MDTTNIAIVLAIGGLLPAFIAGTKGRSPVGWWLYGTALLPVALVHALRLSDGFDDDLSGDDTEFQCRECSERLPQKATRCRYCGTPTDSGYSGYPPESDSGAGGWETPPSWDEGFASIVRRGEADAVAATPAPSRRLIPRAAAAAAVIATAGIATVAGLASLGYLGEGRRDIAANAELRAETGAVGRVSADASRPQENLGSTGAAARPSDGPQTAPHSTSSSLPAPAPKSVPGAPEDVAERADASRPDAGADSGPGASPADVAGHGADRDVPRERRTASVVSPAPMALQLERPRLVDSVAGTPARGRDTGGVDIAASENPRTALLSVPVPARKPPPPKIDAAPDSATATQDAGNDAGGDDVTVVGGLVAWLQRELAARGYYSGPVNGRAGKATREAIRAFERDQGAVPRGEVDRTLIASLRRTPR